MVRFFAIETTAGANLLSPRRGTIIRAHRDESAPAHEVLGAPKPRAPRARGNADEIDTRLRDLVAMMARGIVDRPDAVRVDIIEPGRTPCSN